MIRVKDAEKSLLFYQEIMGMSLIRSMENNEAGFTLYFLAYPISYKIPSPSTSNYTAHREGLLELTWNHGTENDPAFAYHSGNTAPQGFGHICKCIEMTDSPYELIIVCRRFSWWSRRRMRSFGKQECQLEKEADRWENERYCIRPRSRRVLDWDYSKHEAQNFYIASVISLQVIVLISLNYTVVFNTYLSPSAIEPFLSSCEPKSHLFNDAAREFADY